MSFKYFYLDNSYSRTIHYAETLSEAIEEAKGKTYGRSIEIQPRYGGMFGPSAIVEPSGRVIQGMELIELRRKNY